jgi:hypothetical protein
MAGRVPLTRDQALAAQAALIAAREALAFSPQGIAERIRLAQKKAMMERD